MAKSFKFKNDIYLDSSSVVYNHMTLDKYLTQDYINIKNEVQPLKIYKNLTSTILVDDIEIFSAYAKQIGNMTFLSIILRTKTGLPSIIDNDSTPCCIIPTKYAKTKGNGMPLIGCYTTQNYDYPEWLYSSGMNPALCMIYSSGRVLIKTTLRNQKAIVIQAVY